MGQIHELLAKCRDEIGVISKAHANTQQGYSFRSVEDALSVCGPTFTRHGVTPSICVKRHKVTVGERQTKNGGSQQVYHATVRMAVTFTAADGSSVENISAGEGLDYAGDKATSKAMSQAFKYAIFLGLCIPVDGRVLEDSDRPSLRKDGRVSKPRSIEGSNTAAALAAIENAHSEAKLDQYWKAVEERTNQGQYTADDYKALEMAVTRKRGQLRNGKVPAHA